MLARLGGARELKLRRVSIARAYLLIHVAVAIINLKCVHRSSSSSLVNCQHATGEATSHNSTTGAEQAVLLVEQKLITDTRVDHSEPPKVDLSGQRRINHEGFNELSRLRDKCSRAEQTLDSCSAQLIDFAQGNVDHSMNNMDELNDVFCPKVKQAAACIKNNTDCYKPFERQIINWVLTSTRRLNSKRCKNESEKLRFLRLTQSCSNVMRSPMNKCMSNYISNLEAIADLNKYIERLSEDDIQIQLSCCANMRFKQCVMTSAKNHCKPADRLRKLQRANSVSSQRVVQKYLQRSTFDMMEDLKQVLDSMALTGPEFICRSVDESFCQAKFDGRFKGRRPRHKSILPAMLNIYSNKPE